MEYKNLEEVLQDVCGNIRLDKEEIKQRNMDIEKLINDHLIPVLKQDKLFTKLFLHISGSGSFYEGLKVSKPDEFDLTVVMRVPNMPKKNPPLPYDPRWNRQTHWYGRPTKIKIHNIRAPPGYVYIENLDGALDNIKNKNPKDYEQIYKPMECWYDGEEYFLPGKFKSWFESIFSKFIDLKRNNLENSLKLNHLSYKKSGPAFTLKMKFVNGDFVSVDFVPVLAIYMDDRYTLNYFKPLPQDIEQPWYLVPTPLLSRDDKAWAFSAYMFEKELIKDKCTLKPVIKIVKILRDKKNFKEFKSYFIKSTAYIAMNEGKVDFNQSLGTAFMEFLDYLQERIRNNEVEHIWDRRLNLLQSVSVSKERRLIIADGFKRTYDKIISSIDRGDFHSIFHLIVPDDDDGA